MTARIIPQGFQDLSGGFEQNPFIAVPTTIANLALWLDASDTSTITQSGGAVSQWNDKSGKGYNATQSTGSKQPITGTRTLNALNALDFDGTNDSMVLPSGLYSVPSAANTIFFVAADDLITGTNHQLISLTAAGTKRYHAILNPSTPNFAYVNRSGSSTGATVTSLANTNAHILGFKYDGSSTVTGWYDGGPAGTGGSQSAFTATDANITSFQGTTNFFNGLIAEIILYTRALSNAEINQVGSYLATKWGTVWTNIDPSMTWGDLTGVTWGNLTPTEWGI